MNELLTDESWEKALSKEFQKEYFLKMLDFLNQEKATGKVIYPEEKLIFNAFNSVSLPGVRVVILGQDPYHGPNQAHGLSFSVPKTEKIPPSLRNVYKELEADITGFVKPSHGNLEAWANQGVFLLNASLTVEHKKAASHQKIGWMKFTDQVIKTISDQREGCVFMLWGGFAKKKATLIDTSKHLVLESAHPSPLAGNAFLGNQHFSTANEYLKSKGYETIDWKL